MLYYTFCRFSLQYKRFPISLYLEKSIFPSENVLQHCTQETHPHKKSGRLFPIFFIFLRHTLSQSLCNFFMQFNSHFLSARDNLLSFPWKVHFYTFYSPVIYQLQVGTRWCTYTFIHQSTIWNNFSLFILTKGMMS